MRFPQPISPWKLYRGPAILAAVISIGPSLMKSGSLSYLVPLAQLCGIYSITVTGLSLLMGLAGQVSLGQAAFYAMGAYAGAALVTAFRAPLWAAVPAAVILTGISAAIVGFPILRLRGHYLALATLCIGVIVPALINTMEVTGGAEGLLDLPSMRFPGFAEGDPVGNYLIIWLTSFFVFLWAVRLTESPAGRAMRAVHGDEEAAQSLGISPFAVKLKVFVASGVLAGISGVLYAFVYTPSYLGLEEFGLMTSVVFLMMTVLGGLGSLWGGLVGTALYLGLREVIAFLSEKMGSTDSSRYEQLVFGLLLVLVMIFSRDGLIPGLSRAGKKLLRLRGRA